MSKLFSSVLSTVLLLLTEFALLTGILPKERIGTLTTSQYALTVEDCTVCIIEAGWVQGASHPTATPTGSPGNVSTTTTTAVIALSAAHLRSWRRNFISSFSDNKEISFSPQMIIRKTPIKWGTNDLANIHSLAIRRDAWRSCLAKNMTKPQKHNWTSEVDSPYVT